MSSYDKEAFAKKVALLEQFKERYQSCQAEEDKLYSVFPNSFDGGLVESYHKLIDFNVKTLALALGVHARALDWFIYDNEFGASELTSSCLDSEEIITIDSCEAFLKAELGV